MLYIYYFTKCTSLVTEVVKFKHNKVYRNKRQTSAGDSVTATRQVSVFSWQCVARHSRRGGLGVQAAADESFMPMPPRLERRATHCHENADTWWVAVTLSPADDCLYH